MPPNPFSTQAGVSAMNMSRSDSVPTHAHRALTLSGIVRRAVQLVALGLAFLTGFLPMWIKAGRHAVERDSARRALRLVQLEALAAAGTVDARRGRYDWSRQSINHWFTVLRTELELGPNSCLSPNQRAALGPLLARQEELMSALGQGNDSSVVSLTAVYLTCREALRGG